MEDESQEDYEKAIRDRIFESLEYCASQPRLERFELEGDRRFVDTSGNVYDDIEVRYPGCEIEDDPGGDYPAAILIPVERRYPREILYVSLDELSRNYGGPEEGGWWYDSGEVVECHAVLVYFIEDKPHIPDMEKSFLNRLAMDWANRFGAIGTSNRSSMAQREPDYIIRAEHDKPKDWSNYRPYC